MNTRSSIYVKLGFITLLIGFLGLAWPFVYDFLWSENSSIENEDSSIVAQVQLPTFEDVSVSTGEDVSPTPIPTPLPTPASKPPIVKDHLVISSVNINMPVFLGDTEKTLNKGGWLFPTTSRPEKGGNSVIFGHRYMYRPPKSNTFWNLDKVNIGDEMVLYWKGKEYKYKVFQKKIVEPKDLSVMKPSSGSILTVITCTPLFTTKQRLVIVGTLVP